MFYIINLTIGSDYKLFSTKSKAFFNVYIISKYSLYINHWFERNFDSCRKDTIKIRFANRQVIPQIKIPFAVFGIPKGSNTGMVSACLFIQILMKKVKKILYIMFRCIYVKMEVLTDSVLLSYKEKIVCFSL